MCMQWTEQHVHAIVYVCIYVSIYVRHRAPHVHMMNRLTRIWNKFANVVMILTHEYTQVYSLDKRCVDPL